MKLIKSLLIFFLACSCTKILNDYEVKTNGPEIIIEGVIIDSLTSHYVKITKSGTFENTTATSQIVENAFVTIEEEGGKTDTLKYTERGIYKSAKWAGTPGKTYYLKAVVEGKMFTAADKMPINFGFSVDSFYSKFAEFAPRFNNYGQFNFSDKRYIFTNDSVFKVFLNGRFENTENGFYRGEMFRNSYIYRNPKILLLFNTQYFSGKISDIEIPAGFIRNDTVSFHIYTISPVSYRFYQSFRQLINYEGGIFSPPPGNPVSNISGGFGLFEASRIKKYYIIVK